MAIVSHRAAAADRAFDAVKRFYKNWTVVNDIDDLVKVCLSELDRLLRKGKDDSRKRRGKAKA